MDGEKQTRGTKGNKEEKRMNIQKRSQRNSLAWSCSSCLPYSNYQTECLFGFFSLFNTPRWYTKKKDTYAPKAPPLFQLVNRLVMSRVHPVLERSGQVEFALLDLLPCHRQL